MKLTKPDRKRLIYALTQAIEVAEGLIDAYNVSFRRVQGELKRCVPEEFRGIVEKWERDIKAYEKLIARLQDANQRRRDE